MSPNEPQSSFVSSKRYQKKRSQAGIAIGFAILLLLIFMTAWLSLSQMNRNQTQLQRVLDEHVTKLELINQMRHAARERTIAMQKILLLDDPFEQDEVFLAFNQFGAQFAQARLAYIELGLTPDEKETLDVQDKYVGKNVPVQLEIIDLVMRGDKEQAHRLLIEQAIPVQDNILGQLTRLHTTQREAAQLAAINQSLDYTEARSLILSFVMAIAALGIIVAVVVFIRTRRFQQALYETREQAIVTLKSIGEAVISTDSHGHVEYLNRQAESLLGHRFAELHGKSLAKFIDLRQNGGSFDFANILTMTIQSGERYFGSNGLELHCPSSNTKYLIELTAAPIFDQGNHIIGTVIAMRDVTTLRALDAELSFQATHDSLTGLLNRREFEQRILKLLDQTRIDRDEHAVCYIDLDMFKAVNDSCGHIAGDELLRQLAMLLHESIRKSDALARVGGDEFALLLKSCDMAKAKTLAEHLLTIIEGFRFHWSNKTFNIGASIGVAPIRSDSGTLMSIMQTADFACYSAKEAGRNRVYTAEDTEMVGQRRGDAQWMTRLNEAIENNRFELYYQDIKSLRTRTNNTRHVELLLRMKNENDGIEIPMSFIPAAERYHMMPTIDRWVITEATSLIATARSQGLGYNWKVNINLSGQSLSDKRFLDFVMEQIESSNVPPECICFEVTETCAISNLSGAIRFMNTLKGIGCHFSLDDFGSGLSSFAYLKSLPIDSIKIDGIFIRDLEHDMTHRAIVTSIARVARVMNINTIAEFVENNETCNILKDIGVDFAQGYHYGKPMPFQDEIMKKNVQAVDS